VKKIILFLKLCAFLILFQANNAFSINFYWVGGSGNYDDLNHWATTSGGSVMHNYIPTAIDDIFFDANSGFTPVNKTVTINVNTLLCKNMNWTGATNTPVLAGSSFNVLKIYGSLTLINDMDITFSGDINFEATTLGNTIKTSGITLNNNIYFLGSGGEWILSDDLTLNTINLKAIYFNFGTLNTNGQNIYCYKFHSRTSNDRTLNLGSSVITLTHPFAWDWGALGALNIITTNMIINAGTSKFRFTGGSSVDLFPYINGGSMSIYNGGNSQTINLYDVEFLYASGTAELYVGSTITLNFHNVSFGGNGVINGNATYNDLNLYSGKQYLLNNGKTQTINNNINIVGTNTCNSIISIESDVDCSSTNIRKTTGSITLDHVSLRDINAIGGASFTANNSIDKGGNTGWTIIAPASLNLYWIDGTGNWNDDAHWSLTSGGTSAGCIPTSHDNVFFDGGSFSSVGQIVTVNIENANCRDMDWNGVTNNPKLDGLSTNVLKIYGSLRFITSMTIDFSGNINFESRALGNTITTNNQTLNNHIYFNGCTGGWTLLDPLTLNAGNQKSIYFQSGSFNTGNQNVYCYMLSSKLSTTRILTLGSSILTFICPSANFYNDAALYLNPTNLTVNCGTSLVKCIGGSSGISAGGVVVFGGSNIITLYDIQLLFTDGPANSTILDSKYYGGLIMHDVLFAGSGTIYGNNTYNNLTLTSGKTFVLEDGKTQTIITNILQTGPLNCGNTTTIESLTSNNFATISKTTAGNIMLNWMFLKDNHAVGGVSFTANNSLDLGGNTGWTIIPFASRILYWVGGTGNWDDQAHWSLSSGGLGGECIPTSIDDVFFDGGSGFTLPTGSKTVTINIENARCRSMNWTGATNSPVLAGSSTNKLNISGSLTFINAMNITFTGDINFKATTLGHAITTNGKILNNHICFLGSDGGWTLQDSLTLLTSQQKNIYFDFGTLNTNNQKISCYCFQSRTTNNRTLTLGSSVITIYCNLYNINSYTAFDIYSDNLTITPNTSSLRFNSPTLYGSYCGALRVTGTANVTLYDVDFLNPTGISQIWFDNPSTLTLHNVIFYGSGDIHGNITYHDLTLKAGNTYIFEISKTQTILDHLWAQGSCTSYIIMQSSVNGSHATFCKANGAVLAYNVHMRDIHSNCGANFIAYESVDLTNNTGWNFLALPPMLYLDSIVGPDSFCSGASNNNVIYYVPSAIGVISYDWSVPSGATITHGQGDTLITVDFGSASSGYIYVRGFNGCNYSDTMFFYVDVDILNMNLGNDTTLCTGNSLTLDAQYTGSNYLWSTGATTQTINVLTTDTYSVTITNGGCIASDSITVTVNPALLNSYTAAICQGDSVFLDGNWQNTSGVYSDTLTTYTGCDSIIKTTLTVNPVSLNSNTVAICQGDSIFLDGNWQNTSGVYSDTLTTYTGCDSIISTNLSINPLPTASITGDTLICTGTSTLLTATGGTSYLWSTTAITQSITVNPTSGTIYSVTVSDAGCSSSTDISIFLFLSPTANAGNDTTIMIGASVQLNATGGAIYQWYPITYLNNPNISDPVSTPTADITYIVYVTDMNGCTDFDTIIITVNDAGNIFIPNTFSPNGDGRNDILYVRGNDINKLEFFIYDRWGEKVFETRDKQQGWDGTYKGKKLFTAVFVYYVEAKLYNGKTIMQKGNITLVR